MIDEYPFLSEEEKQQLHLLRKYRNKWVHIDQLGDTPILQEEIYAHEIENMAFLSIKLMLLVLFSQPSL